MDRRLAFGLLLCATSGVAACTTGGGDVTYPNPLNPTPGPRASATVAPTSSPTPSSSPTSSGCPPSYPSSPATETVALPPAGGTISIPNFGDFMGTATTSSLTLGGGATVALEDSTQPIVPLSMAPVPAGQTGVFFVQLVLSQTVTFSNPNIPTVITANCTIVPGATYTANVYAFGGPVQAQQTAVAVGHSLTFTIIVPAEGEFPGGVPADVVVSH
jgi:hypothetical protein